MPGSKRRELVAFADCRRSDDARLGVTGGSLTFPQTDYSQYTLVLKNRSHLTLTGSTLVTNGTQKNNFSMLLDAYDSSVTDFEGSFLSTDEGSWLLGNFHDHARLNTVASGNLPTEIYPFDSSQISVSSHSRIAGSFPNSDVVVNGRGAAGTSDVDLVFGYYIVNNSSPVAVDGLTGGIIDVSTCVLQLAVAGAFGPGSRMSISGTQIWSQAVQAQSGGRTWREPGQRELRLPAPSTASTSRA